jgi:hypothetical protein
MGSMWEIEWLVKRIGTKRRRRVTSGSCLFESSLEPPTTERAAG